MPQAESTAATRGTTTRVISSIRATPVTCSPAAPPKARSAKRRGSAPRRTETMRMPSAMFVLTTRWIPSAAATVLVPSRFAGDRVVATVGKRRGTSTVAAAQEVGGIKEAEDDVGVGHGSRSAAAAVAGGAGQGARALRPDVENAARVHVGDGAAARAQGV